MSHLGVESPLNLTHAERDGNNNPRAWFERPRLTDFSQLVLWDRHALRMNSQGMPVVNFEKDMTAGEMDFRIAQLWPELRRSWPGPEWVGKASNRSRWVDPLLPKTNWGGARPKLSQRTPIHVKTSPIATIATKQSPRARSTMSAQAIGDEKLFMIGISGSYRRSSSQVNHGVETRSLGRKKVKSGDDKKSTPEDNSDEGKPKKRKLLNLHTFAEVTRFKFKEVYARQGGKYYSVIDIANQDLKLQREFLKDAEILECILSEGEGFFYECALVKTDCYDSFIKDLQSVPDDP